MKNMHRTKIPSHPHLRQARAEYWSTPAGNRALRTVRFGRPGTLAPQTAIVYWGGRWRVAFEWERCGLKQTIGNLLKTVYRKRELKHLIYRNNPFLSLIPRRDEFRGGNFKIPLTRS